VWRVADSYLRPGNGADLVCVEPAQREQAAADNAARESRWVPLRVLDVAKPGTLLKLDKAIQVPMRN
jgi:hypothetical protein